MKLNDSKADCAKCQPQATEAAKGREIVAVVICNEPKFSCYCALEIDHEGPHVCRCEGSWNIDGSIVNLPNIIGI